jgi:hypothetical protein
MNSYEAPPVAIGGIINTWLRVSFFKDLRTPQTGTFPEMLLPHMYMQHSTRAAWRSAYTQQKPFQISLLLNVHKRETQDKDHDIKM